MKGVTLCAWAIARTHKYLVCVDFHNFFDRPQMERSVSAAAEHKMPHARGKEAPARCTHTGSRPWPACARAKSHAERYLMYANHLLALLFTATTPRALRHRRAARGLTRELRSSFAY
jgi:hypothetical protein